MTEVEKWKERKKSGFGGDRPHSSDTWNMILPLALLLGVHLFSLSTF